MQRIVHHAVDGITMCLLRDAGHDTAPWRVQLCLRRDGLAQDAPVGRDHSCSSVIAATFDAKNQYVPLMRSHLTENRAGCGSCAGCETPAHAMCTRCHTAEARGAAGHCCTPHN
jgi:hypothetical protein